MVALMFGALSYSSAAQEISGGERADLSNKVDEHVRCSALYMLASQCNKGRAAPEVVDPVERGSRELFGKAFVLGQTLGLQPDRVRDKFQKQLGSMMSDIGNDCRKVTVLVERDVGRCSSLEGSPPLVNQVEEQSKR
jgi:hypothetical protein